MASFRLFAWRYFAAKRRKDAMQKDEITSCDKTKRRKDATRKDNKIKVSNGVSAHGVFRLFTQKFHLFAWRVSAFRLFAWHYYIFTHCDFFVFSFFRIAFFRLFVWRLFAAKRRKDAIAQSSHHNLCTDCPTV